MWESTPQHTHSAMAEASEKAHDNTRENDTTIDTKNSMEKWRLKMMIVINI